MQPRILIFAATPDRLGTAAAGAACELVAPGAARALSLDLARDPRLRADADLLAASLDLRPVARQLAVLARITALLRETSNATIVIDAGDPSQLTGLLAAADLARARLDAARPPAGASTLAASRQGSDPDLPVLRDAAIAGDLLRAPEITVTGLCGEPATDDQLRTELALAGLAVARGTLPGTPDAAATSLIAAHTQRDAVVGAAPRAVATATGAELELTLPSRPIALRAVRSADELVISAGATERRLKAPLSLGQLLPGGLAAGDDGRLVATFTQHPESGT